MASAAKRVLFVQHTSALGGSCVSLRNTIKSLDPTRYTGIVALARPSDAVEAYYRDEGIEAFAWPEVPLWDHSTGAPRPLHSPRTWKMAGELGLRWRRGMRATSRLVAATSADLVHLNSMALSCCAAALIARKYPFVWHVREQPAPAAGIRYRAIRALLRKADALIFISDADRRAWVNDSHGVVIENFVDLERFANPPTRNVARSFLDLPPDAPVILYLGGIATIKGIFVLLDALATLRNAFPNILCLMPGTSFESSGRLTSHVARTVLPLFGSGTQAQLVQRAITRNGLTKACVVRPYARDILPYLGAADVLVFPSTAPHFARPVIEAQAAGVPVVASALDGPSQLIDDGQTGLLVPASVSGALGAAIARVLSDRALSTSMARAAQLAARERFDARRQANRIMDIYDSVLRAHDPQHEPSSPFSG